MAIKVDAIVLGELGLNLSEAEIVDRFVGQSQKEFQNSIELLLGEPLPKNWEAKTRPIYREAYRRELKPIDGIREAIAKIDVPTCVASSGSHEKIRFTLGLTGLYPLFEGRIFSATEVARGKPEPDLFLYAAERMGVDPEACAVVEDSALGVAAARKAGMKAFAFSGSVTPAKKLQGPETTVFGHMSELPELLKKALG